MKNHTTENQGRRNLAELRGIKRFVSPVVALFVVFSSLTYVCARAHAQIGTPRFTDTLTGSGSLFGVQEQKLTYLDKDGKATQPGKTFSEVLAGNGTRAGYVLSHGGIIPGSVSVSVSARSLRANVDYYLDYANGTIAFAEPVRRGDSIRAYYRFIEGQDGARNPSGLSNLQLNFQGSSVSLGFGLSTGAGGMDFNTYGLSLNSKVGSGGLLNGMVYFSNPSENRGNKVTETRASLNPTVSLKNQEEAKSGHLISQNLALKSGGASFRASYQDIGMHFNGFQAMKSANAKNADVLAQLNAMEKEKGIQRLGFGAGLKINKTEKDNIGIDWDRITDGKGEIVKRSLGFQSGALTLKMNEQQVGEGFTRFNDLREAEKAQWAKEKGVKRSELTLGLAPAKGTAFGFNRSSIGDKSGSLATQGYTFDSKTFKFGMTTRKADAAFTRLNDLSDADKTLLALDIRRQFNLNATAAEVTAKDKEQIALEAGLTRSQMGFSGLLGKADKQGKQAGFQFNQFGIDDGKGKIARRTLGFKGSSFDFTYLDQNIDESFGKLGAMSDFEKTQFANEHGIHRNLMGLNLNLSKASSLALSQLALSDKDGSLARQSIVYTAKGMDFKLNMADTSKTFARAKDLAATSDAEKAQIEAERGYKRTDYSLNMATIKGIKGLNLSTYVYDAHNADEKLDKSLFRHNLNWQLGKSRKISWLSEGNRFDKEGTAQDGLAHTLTTFDEALGKGKGMKLSAYHDTVARITGAKDVPTVTTDFLHFETDKSKANNLLAETKRIDLGAGKFENTTQLDMNYRASKAMTLHFNKLEIDRGKDPSANTDLLQWNWQMTKTLNFTGMFAETTTNDKNDATLKSFGLTGSLTKNLNITGTYTEVDTHGKNVKAVSDIAISNAKPFDLKLLGLKGLTFSGRYAATNDKQKTQAENSSAKLAGMLGKNQFALEYGNTLAPDGKAAVARTFIFVSDPNTKLPLHIDLLYKARNVNRGELQLVRKYNVTYTVDKLTTASYVYNSLPEDAALTMQPVKSSAFTFKRTITKTINLAMDYTTAKQLAAKTATSKLGCLMQGRLDKLTAIEVGYSVDINDQAGTRSDGHTIRLGYDHQIDADHAFTISTTFTDFRGKTPDAVQANLDFRTRF